MNCIISWFYIFKLMAQWNLELWGWSKISFVIFYGNSSEKGPKLHKNQIHNKTTHWYSLTVSRLPSSSWCEAGGGVGKFSLVTLDVLVRDVTLLSALPGEVSLGLGLSTGGLDERWLCVLASALPFILAVTDDDLRTGGGGLAPPGCRLITALPAHVVTSTPSNTNTKLVTANKAN